MEVLGSTIYTPLLHFACRNFGMDSVRLFIEMGAKVNATDIRGKWRKAEQEWRDGMRPLFYAILEQNRIHQYDRKAVIGTSNFWCGRKTNAQKDKYLAKAYPFTPQEVGIKKIRLNFPTIVNEGISNLRDLLNQLYNKKVLDENDIMLIEQAHDISNKTRKLLSILFIKDPIAWVFDVLLHIKNSPDTVFLYQMIANTYTGLDSCHQADMWKIVMQADNRNHKAVVLKEMIRQNLMYLSRVLTKKPLTEIDMSVFADAELEYITSQPDKKQEVKASLICLLGRENVGWVFEFIGMLLNDGRNQLLADVFGTTNVTEI